jgi:hypothetical protein
MLPETRRLAGRGRRQFPLVRHMLLLLLLLLLLELLRLLEEERLVDLLHLLSLLLLLLLRRRGDGRRLGSVRQVWQDSRASREGARTSLKRHLRAWRRSSGSR